VKMPAGDVTTGCACRKASLATELPTVLTAVLPKSCVVSLSSCYQILPVSEKYFCQVKDVERAHNVDMFVGSVTGEYREGLSTCFVDNTINLP